MGSVSELGAVVTALAELGRPLEIQKFFDALTTLDRQSFTDTDKFLSNAISRAHQDSIERTVIELIEQRDTIAEIHASNMRRLSNVEAADDPADGADEEYFSPHSPEAADSPLGVFLHKSSNRHPNTARLCRAANDMEYTNSKPHADQD